MTDAKCEQRHAESFQDEESFLLARLRRRLLHRDTDR